MIDSMAKVSAAGLFATSAANGFVLWFRASRREKWEAVARAETESKALDAIGCGQRRGGQWLFRPSDREP